MGNLVLPGYPACRYLVLRRVFLLSGAAGNNITRALVYVTVHARKLEKGLVVFKRRRGRACKAKEQGTCNIKRPFFQGMGELSKPGGLVHLGTMFPCFYGS